MSKGLYKLANKYKRNIILILLIIGGILNDFILRALTIGMKFYWKPILASVSIILFISTLTSLLSHKRRNYIFVILSWVFSLINIANYLYYKHFDSFLSLFLVKQIKFIKDIKGSVFKTLDLKILIFLAPSILLLLFLKKLNGIDFFNDIKSPCHKKETLKPFAMGVLFLVLVLITLTETDFSRISKLWNRPYIVEQLGIYTYTAADIVKNAITDNDPLPVPEKKVEYLLEDLFKKNIESKKDNEYKDIFKGRDIYVIHYESAQSFVINEELADVPITPFLNKLASEGLYFNNFYPQHSAGTSSDSEFTFNTSLLPIDNGTVFVTHSDREYLTLQKLLKKEDYFTISMHGNNKDFWNRDIMHKNLGYDEFLSKEDYIIDEEIGLGLSDVSFFRQSVEKIKKIKEREASPILATLITLTNHYPFDDLDKYGPFDVEHLEGTSIGNYFKSYHYADNALKTFIDRMDSEGLLDNAVVVLYGDHHANIPDEDYEKFFNYDKKTDDYYEEDTPEYTEIDEILSKKLKRTPFIIWSKDRIANDIIDTPMGMVDALPTLANMIGITNPYQLGIDIMSATDNVVVFPDTSWINNKYFYSTISDTYYDLNNEKEIEKTLELLSFTESAESKIEISNNIVNNDLIKAFKELFAKNKRFHEAL